ncbi:hypothetical protein LTS07_005187 [Exophiala sideris]|uniref:NmrA-like domain-containing protein n=1 Tax=Exophiala sideris TaxID=1016849 RepID=A0ABR0JCA9_9EURO|nr:hypothetical protein LTS07_005187 [Exophiala sideris]KAK5038456.1 hypothetical protein LTR13_004203 [Exophiala sideris]KAK5060339.1 hypothetical protein LTR69_005656 [Exophiala sideris]KAK5183249.1 hypothetical protein LTR44_004250 [Eurotiomycetes sp. CCFEE 6388]
MSKLIVVLGGTGNQGGSVIKAFLNDSSFRVRAVARNPSSAAAQALKAKGVDVVQGEFTDISSLTQAFKGANYIYAMTPDIGVNGAAIMAEGKVASVVEEAYRLELQAGKNIVAAADTATDTLEVFILSSLSAAKHHSDHAYQLIYHFDAKADVVKFLESTYPTLARKTAALLLGMFATNWQMSSPLRPTKVKPLQLYKKLFLC